MYTKQLYAGLALGFSGLLFAIILALFMGFPVKWTWNATMPIIFGLKSITWGQAWCLSFLTSTLFKATQSNTNNCECGKKGGG